MPTCIRCLLRSSYDSWWLYPTYQPLTFPLHSNSLRDRCLQSNSAQKFQELLQYLETWITSTSFPPSAWSTFERAVRTNNDAEGWHNCFNQNAPNDKMSLYLLTASLHEETKLRPTQKLIYQKKLYRKQSKKQDMITSGCLKQCSSLADHGYIYLYEHAWNKCICWQNTLRVVLLFILWCIIHNNNMLFTLYTYFDGAFRLGKWCIQSGALSPEGWCIQTRQMVHPVTSMIQYHYSMNNPSIFILYKTGSS